MNCTDIKGSNAVIKLREESEYGEFNQNGYIQIPFNTFGLAYSRNEVESPTIKAGRAPSEKSLGNIEVAGDIAIPLEDKYSHYFLKNLLGNYSVADVAGKKEHTYTISDGCLNSLSFEKSFTDTSLNYLIRGVKFNTFSVEIGGEGQINATIGCMGKDEQLRRVSVDATFDTATVDSNINSNTITVNNGTSFKVGDVIIPRIERGSLLEEAKKGNSAIVLEAGEGSGFQKGYLVELDGITYMIYSVSGDKIVLDRGIEKDSVLGTKIYLVETAYKISAINGNVLTINVPLKNNVITGDLVYSEPATQVIESVNFENAEVEITSTDEEATKNIAYIQTLSMSYENGIEGQRFINSKGKYGKLLEGKVNISCDLNIIFAVENAKLLEEAKVGKTFDIKITLINRVGNSIIINLPIGKLTPVGPAIEGPNAISATLQYSPFGKDLSFKLINDEVYV